MTPQPMPEPAETFGAKVAEAIARYVEAALSMENAERLHRKGSMPLGVLRLRDRNVMEARRAITALFDKQVKLTPTGSQPVGGDYGGRPTTVGASPVGHTTTPCEICSGGVTFLPHGNWSRDRP